MEIKNKLNVWKIKSHYPWYRIDKKFVLFLKKIKWAWQRAKYGYCNYDLWNLDFSIGNYIASSVKAFSELKYSYPALMTEEQWIEILNSISTSFYLAVNEDEWSNPYEEELSNFNIGANLGSERYAKFLEIEEVHEKQRDVRLQDGFTLLEKHFRKLWS